MRSASRFLGSLALAAAIAAPVFTVACGGGGGGHYYRAYDPYYHDYHPWNADEQNYYSQWAVTVHVGDRPYKKLNHDQQEQYWRWRHDHDHH